MGGSHGKKLRPTASKSRKSPAARATKPTKPARRAPARKPRKAVFTCRTIPRRVIAGAEGAALDAPGGWNRLDLTFSVGAPPPGITAAVFQSAVRQALQLWRLAVPFTFTEVAAGGTLSVAGVPADHEDGFNFPPGTTDLAHAFGPETGGGVLDGQVHLNNAKTWADGTGADCDIVTIVLHELGHALGIVNHFGNASTVMNASFPPGLVRRVLTDGDKGAMRALYAHLLT